MTTKLQPYDLVLVRVEAASETRLYSYVGEVMSFATPDDTIMVRRAPGHPGTLEEIPLARIESLKGHEWGKHRFVHYATVNGRGAFPVDMLRYDSCSPLNFTLEDDEHGRKNRAVVDPSFGFDEPVVVRTSKLGRANWTPARWSSFMWGFREVNVEPIRGA